MKDVFDFESMTSMLLPERKQIGPDVIKNVCAFVHFWQFCTLILSISYRSACITREKKIRVFFAPILNASNSEKSM